ncbi:uncharacterized protein LOC123263857 [Cotesia glomerata]|uniref:Uncharacterized protein n=1 Tax=Cotesia glomerata TaxID=32391 RepID=A0AAV7IST5_COTGL|nr:uncharacterized protein LOC123263857 [Cotesia glomerata]KAH0555235.1 hypothetical protein KQX54_016293 [Cotesia glomerata]
MIRLLLLCFVLSFVLFASAEVPSYIPICGRRDPNLNDCIIKSVAQLRPKLREGIPEFDVPPVDPLLINERVTISDTADFKVAASNIKVYDSLDFEVKKFNADMKNQKVDINLFFKKMRFENDYDVKVKILVPIEASGPIESVGMNIESNSTVQFKLLNTKKGQQLFFTSAKSKLKIGDYTVKFVPNNTTAALSEAINAVLNGNRQEIIDTITPHIEKVISAKILEISNQITKHFTYDELFPDRE